MAFDTRGSRIVPASLRHAPSRKLVNNFVSIVFVHCDSPPLLPNAAHSAKYDMSRDRVSHQAWITKYRELLLLTLASPRAKPSVLSRLAMRIGSDCFGRSRAFFTAVVNESPRLISLKK